MSLSKEGRSGSTGAIKGRWVWFGNPVGKLEELKKSVQRRICLKAIRKASGIYRSALKKAPTPRRKGGGALRVAMAVKAYRPKRKDQAIGVIGPKSKYVKTMGVRTRGKNKGKPILYKPGKILHLVNRGFRTRGGGRFQGLHFMERVFKQNWPKVRNEMWRIIGEEVTKELAKK